MLSAAATTLTSAALAPKSVVKVLPKPRAHWVGDGFHVHPILGSLAFSGAVSPFLLLDYAAPKHFPPTAKRLGVGQHPHRGFETVTIAFQGQVEHADSLGNTDTIGVGDVQWMTAGRGIIHEEFHARSFAKQGGTFEMVQLWVNLPAEHKMTAPRYQPILAANIPTVNIPTILEKNPAGQEARDERGVCEAEGSDGARVRVIAGAFRGRTGPAKTFTPIELWEVILPKPAEPVELEVPEGQNTLLLVRSGGASLVGAAEERIGGQSLAVLSTAGRKLRLVGHEADTRLLLMSGTPIDEPIAARGPFVMNTMTEIAQANQDFMSGVLGR